MQREFLNLDNKVKHCLQSLGGKTLDRDEKTHADACRKALRVLRLDVRDYEYAETRVEQLKWSGIAQNNLKALEYHMLALGTYFGPADIAEMSAHIDLLKSKIV